RTGERIEALGSTIYRALYDPPISGSPINTLDVPVAGHGYNALPFVFDLVNEANNVEVADTTTRKDVNDKLLLADVDGQLTLSYLNAVDKGVARLTGDSPMSLGAHRVVYFDTRNGTFQPIALLAASRFVEKLASQRKLEAFTTVRERFEQYLVDRKEALSLL